MNLNGGVKWEDHVLILIKILKPDFLANLLLVKNSNAINKIATDGHGYLLWTTIKNAFILIDTEQK